MAERIDLTQHRTVVSVPKVPLLEKVVYNTELNERDLRVVIFLLTSLDGYNSEYGESKHRKDPYNYRNIDLHKIADELMISKKDVKKSLKKLVFTGVLERGDSSTVEDGYRFTF